jgi:hypothetical protein
MKAHRRTRNALRALALAGCASALVLPSAAGARPIADQPAAAPAAPSSSFHPHGRPAAFATAGTTGYPLPAGFTTDAQSSGRASTAGTAGYQLPADFTTDAQSGGRAPTAAQAPSVIVREIRTVTNGPDHTLALVLASAALGIALCGSAYAVFRTTRIQRRVLGSNS